MQNIYQFTTPIFIKQLSGLKNVLSKCEAFCKEKGIKEEDFFGYRLWDDMFPFVKQVQVATDNAKGAVARLSGMEVPSYEDNEKTFAELQARVDRTLEFVKSVPESAFEGAEGREVSLSYWGGKHMSGFEYARQYALPNFLFHVVTAYDIARTKGVPVGKSDYINGLPLEG